MTAAVELGVSSAGRARPQPEPRCAHCGLPVSAARVEPLDDEQFCCDGCRSVFAILHDAGLEEYYVQRDRSNPETGAPQRSQRKFEELDEPSFRERHCQDRGDGVLRSEFFVEGVHCSACVWLLERLPRVTPAVLEARYDLTRSVIQITWDPASTPLSKIARALDSLGYTPHPTHSTNLVAEQRKGDRALLLRLGIAGAAAGNVMLMALALYSGKYAGMAAEYAALFRWGSLAIATPAVFWAGNVFFRGGLAALRTRTPHMDLPVSLGILAGYLGSAANTVRGHGEIYFDSLCTLIFLLLVGRYLQRTHQRRSAKASDLINALAPTTASVLDGETTREVPANTVAVGSIVEIRAGERVAVDGVVNDGSSALDTSLLTGESFPEEVTVGDRVHAGTTNLSARLRVRAESVGSETRLGRLMQSVEATQRERAPIVRLADRVAGYFVLAIVGIAVLTLLVWMKLDVSHAIDHTVALLVVTCPCALGMATPLAVSAALRAAARGGILFKGGEFIEELARPGIIVFDKTGTLTEGRLALVTWYGDQSIRPLVRAAEATSGHPIARAFQRSLTESDLVCTERREYPGGVHAQVSGRDVLVGSQSLVRATLGSLPTWCVIRAQAHAAAGQTPVLIAIDGKVCAIAAFADTVRADAAASLVTLAELGFQLEVLSGDDQRVVDSVVRELGVPLLNATGGASPEAKLAAIASLRATGNRVFMVGDGVNDAAAMAAANVGIAVHGGAEACLAAADVFTTRPGLQTVALAALGSKRTMRVIRIGIGLSLAYNVLGVALAVSGRLDPLWAAILMPLSSITVVTAALRARTFQRSSRA
ncbi:MAG: heavy metal translocating P-type ATPase [Pseudomonadota bacterium]